jgi:hypothetical protein
VKTEEEMSDEVEGNSSTSEPLLEEKSSTPIAKIERQVEEKASSGSKKKRRRYDGSGRKTTDEMMDDILDRYILTGQLPQDVSEKSRTLYRNHPRLPLRRMQLEREGKLKKGASVKTGKSRNNVLPLRRRKA